MLLFGRTRKAVREIEPKEWALLAFESFGVLLGILVAFQLNEWASGKKDAARNHQLVERLFEESQVVVAQLRGERDDIKQMTDREAQFATALVRDRTCPPQDAWFAAFTTNMYPAIGVQTSVYDEMMGAGGLSTIPDTRSRENVAIFHSALAWVNSQTDNRREHLIPTVTMDDSRVTAGFEPNAEEPLKVTVDREALCGDKAFRNRVADAVRDHQLVYGSRAELTVLAIKMCNALGAALSRQCEPAWGGPLKDADANVSVIQGGS